MLPRNFPKLGNLLVNPTPKIGGIELDIEMGEPGFGFYRNVMAIEDPLIRGLGGIIPLAGFVANPFFGNQLEGWLKGVDVEA